MFLDEQTRKKTEGYKCAWEQGLLPLLCFCPGKQLVKHTVTMDYTQPVLQADLELDWSQTRVLPLPLRCWEHRLAQDPQLDCHFSGIE